MNGPRTVVALAVHALPSSTRDRYQAEVDAELGALSGVRQWAHVLAFAATTWPLRMALLKSAAETRGFPAAPLRCLLGLGHRWRRMSTPDGQPYRACARCGLDDPRISQGLADRSALGVIAVGRPQ